jgi:nucleoside recognition membrane protein YjiH
MSDKLASILRCCLSLSIVQPLLVISDSNASARVYSANKHAVLMDVVIVSVMAATLITCVAANVTDDPMFLNMVMLL